MGGGGFNLNVLCIHSRQFEVFVVIVIKVIYIYIKWYTGLLWGRIKCKFSWPVSNVISVFAGGIAPGGGF